MGGLAECAEPVETLPCREVNTRILSTLPRARCPEGAADLNAPRIPLGLGERIKGSRDHVINGSRRQGVKGSRDQWVKVSRGQGINGSRRQGIKRAMGQGVQASRCQGVKASRDQGSIRKSEE